MLAHIAGGEWALFAVRKYVHGSGGPPILADGPAGEEIGGLKHCIAEEEFVRHDQRLARESLCQKRNISDLGAHSDIPEVGAPSDLFADGLRVGLVVVIDEIELAEAGLVPRRSGIPAGPVVDLQ